LAVSNVARIRPRQGGASVHERIRNLLTELVAIKDSRIREARAVPLERMLRQLQSQIPHPPKSPADLVALAQIAAYLRGGPPDAFEHVTGQLIAAVLQFGEIRLADLRAIDSLPAS
jgi:hypothetical protein